MSTGNSLFAQILKGRRGVLNACVLSLAVLILPTGVTATTVDLILDSTVYLRAGDVKILQGGMVAVILQQAPNDPLVLPAERVRCVAGPQCPEQLALQTNEALKSFEIQGSNTIGDKLMPELVTEYITRRLKASSRQTASLQDDARKTISFDPPGGGKVDVIITAKGSGTGYAPLMGETQPSSEIWMSSRRADANEIANARKLGVDLLSAENEHIIALDGLGIIVNIKNPLTAISTDELAEIFSGKTTRWEDVKSGFDSLGHPTLSGEIKLYRRDNKSGTTSTFNDLVFAPYFKHPGAQNSCLAALTKDVGACFSPKASPYDKSNQLETDVNNDPLGIGYVGIGSIENTKPLGVVVNCASGSSAVPRQFAYSPSEFNIKTEEYPLSRRLYLYTRGKPANPLASALVDFARSEDAGEAIRKSGFYESSITAEAFKALGERFAAMIGASEASDRETRDFLSDIRFATRLSTTLRFADKAATLDNKALDDVRLLADALNHTYQGRQFVVAGFSDAMSDPERARQLSADRALAVAAALSAQGVKVFRENAHAYGAAAPVACDDTEMGRALNRRVEIWIK